MTIPFFEDLPKSVSTSIKNVAIYRSYVPGKFIITEGKACQAAYLILRGKVNIFRVSANGRKLVLSRLDPGDWFNAISCFQSQENNPANACALTPVKVLALTGSDFRKLLEDHPVLALKIMDNLSTRLRTLTNAIENLALFSTSGRVARFLLEHCDDSGIIYWQCTQSDVADRLGTVADIVGRVLRKFADDGLIEMPAKNCIVIVDHKGLKKAALN